MPDIQSNTISTASNTHNRLSIVDSDSSDEDNTDAQVCSILFDINYNGVYLVYKSSILPLNFC